MAREHERVKQIKRYLEGLDGCEYRKLHGGPYSVIGDTDIVGAVQCPAGWSGTGSFAWAFCIEVKAPGKTPRPMQMIRIEQWAAVGALTGYAYDAEGVRAILAPALRLRGEAS